MMPIFWQGLYDRSNFFDIQKNCDTIIFVEKFKGVKNWNCT